MATLYDDQEDPLDGAIAALEGIGRGVQAYQSNRRYSDSLAREDEDRRLRLALLARQTARQDAQDKQQNEYQQQMLGLRKEDNSLQSRAYDMQESRRAAGDARDAADSAGIMSTLSSQYGSSTVDPEVRASLEGLKGFAGKMSPEALRVAGSELETFAKQKTFDTARKKLSDQFDSMVAPVGPDGQPAEAQPPANNAQMLGGHFNDAAKVADIRARLKAASTPQQLAAVEADIAAVQQDRVDAIRLGEDRQNWYAALDPMFSEAMQRNEERVSQGGEDQYPEIDALRSRFLEATGPTSGLTRQQLRSEINDIRTSLSKVRSGVSTRSSAPRQFSEMGPDDQAAWEWQHLSDTDKSVTSLDSLRAKYRGQARVPSPAATAAPGEVVRADNGTGQRVQAAAAWIQGIMSRMGELPRDVVRDALIAVRDGEGAEAALRKAWGKHKAAGSAQMQMEAGLSGWSGSTEDYSAQRGR